MSLPPEAVDVTLFWFDLIDPAFRASPFPLLEEEARAFAQAASEAGRAAANATVERLIRARNVALAWQSRERAAVLWRRLRLCRSAERRLSIEATDEYRSWALVECAGEASVDAAADDADRARELAELALFIAERVPGSRPGARGCGATRGPSSATPAAWPVTSGRAPRRPSPAPARSGRTAPPPTPASSTPAGRSTSRRLYGEPSAGGRRRSISSREPGRRALHRSGRAGSSSSAPSPTSRWATAIRALEALEQAEPLVDGRASPASSSCSTSIAPSTSATWGATTRPLPEIAAARALALELRNDLDLLRVTWLEARAGAGRGLREEAARGPPPGPRRALPSAADVLRRGARHSRDRLLLLDSGRAAEVGELAREMTPIFVEPRRPPRGPRRPPALLAGRRARGGDGRARPPPPPVPRARPARSRLASALGRPSPVTTGSQSALLNRPASRAGSAQPSGIDGAAFGSASGSRRQCRSERCSARRHTALPSGSIRATLLSPNAR